MKRIVMHWSAGGHNATNSDKRHYHEIVEGDGDRVRGDLLPEANLSTADGIYTPHTRRFNTGAIGLAMACMSGARERPFAKGRYPMTTVQLETFVDMVAEYADTYSIDVTRENVLTHAEVQITHGVAQNGKWDITWLPHMAKPGNPIEVGDHLRELIRARLDSTFNVETEVLASLEPQNELAIAIAKLVDDYMREHA